MENSSTNHINVSQREYGKTRQRMKRGFRKTTCSKCNKEVEESRKGQRYCKSCHAENMRLKRPKYSELKPEAKFKSNTRSYLHAYVKRGQVSKQLCKVCGKDAEAHHEDYLKPLDVIWFCREHHLEYHKNKP